MFNKISVVKCNQNYFDNKYISIYTFIYYKNGSNHLLNRNAIDKYCINKAILLRSILYDDKSNTRKYYHTSPIQKTYVRY